MEGATSADDLDTVIYLLRDCLLDIHNAADDPAKVRYLVSQGLGVIEGDERQDTTH